MEGQLRAPALACLIAAIGPAWGGALRAQQPDSLPPVPPVVHLQPFEVSGQRHPHPEPDCAAAGDRLDPLGIRALPVADPSAAAALLRGVHAIDPGIGMPVLNVRGFSNTTNVRMVQITDGLDGQAPHIGAPLGNALAASELDIASLEVAPGAESLMRGTNALNGAVLVRTRDPFAEPGLAIRQRCGVNVDGPGALHPISVTDVRLAMAARSRTAVKLTVSQVLGTDRPADDRTDLAAGLNAGVGLGGPGNPAYDPVNGYGNESPNRRTLLLGGQRTVVARTGYDEMVLDERAVRLHRAAVVLYHRPRPGHELRLALHGARSDLIYQRSNRFRMRGHRLGRIALAHEAPAWSLSAAYTAEQTGRSYNMRSLAENMDRMHRADADWFAAYAAAWQQARDAGQGIIEAHGWARREADEGRPLPGTARWDSLRERLASVNDWDRGAALQVRADMLLAQGLFSWHEVLPALRRLGWLRIATGADHRQYLVRPDGNYFIVPHGGAGLLRFGSTGVHAALGADLPRTPLRLEAALRADRCDHFAPQAHWRVAAMLRGPQRVRPWAALQEAHRYPSLFEGFSNVNSGGVRRVGGLRVMSDGVFERSWTRSSIESFRALVNAAVNAQGLTLDEAIAQNAHVLARNPYTYLEPEQVRTLEAGVRAELADGALLLEADGYLGVYMNLMGQVEASIPRVQDPDSVPRALYDPALQQRYRLWTNSRSRMHTRGASVGVRWRPMPRTLLAANAAFARLERTEQEDGLEDAFNTPGLMVNASAWRERIWRQLDAGMAVVHCSAYAYGSFLVEGTVPALWSIDAQAAWSFPRIGLGIRAGGNNVLDRPNRTMLGGAVLGASYHLTVTWEALRRTARP